MSAAEGSLSHRSSLDASARVAAVPARTHELRETGGL